MHPLNFTHDNCNSSNLSVLFHKETQTFQPTHNQESSTSTSGPRCKLPLPREIGNNEKGSLKIIEYCQVLQDSSSKRNITIVREKITEEIHPTSSDNEDNTAKKFRYCREVIKPYLKNYPSDCPDFEEKLLKSILDSAEEDFPDQQPCFTFDSLRSDDTFDELRIKDDIPSNKSATSKPEPSISSNCSKFSKTSDNLTQTSNNNRNSKDTPTMTTTEKPIPETSTQKDKQKKCSSDAGKNIETISVVSKDKTESKTSLVDSKNKNESKEKGESKCSIGKSESKCPLKDSNDKGESKCSKDKSESKCSQKKSTEKTESTKDTKDKSESKSCKDKGETRCKDKSELKCPVADSKEKNESKCPLANIKAKSEAKSKCEKKSGTKCPFSDSKDKVETKCKEKSDAKCPLLDSKDRNVTKCKDKSESKCDKKNESKCPFSNSNDKDESKCKSKHESKCPLLDSKVKSETKCKDKIELKCPFSDSKDKVDTKCKDKNETKCSLLASKDKSETKCKDKSELKCPFSDSKNKFESKCEKKSDSKGPFLDSKDKGEAKCKDKSDSDTQVKSETRCKNKCESKCPFVPSSDSKYSKVKSETRNKVPKCPLVAALDKNETSYKCGAKPPEQSNDTNKSESNCPYSKEKEESTCRKTADMGSTRTEISILRIISSKAYPVSRNSSKCTVENTECKSKKSDFDCDSKPKDAEPIPKCQLLKEAANKDDQSTPKKCKSDSFNKSDEKVFLSEEPSKCQSNTSNKSESKSKCPFTTEHAYCPMDASIEKAITVSAEDSNTKVKKCTKKKTSQESLKKECPVSQSSKSSDDSGQTGKTCRPIPDTLPDGPSSSERLEEVKKNIIHAHEKTMNTLMIAAEDMLYKVAKKTKEVVEDPNAIEKAKCAAEDLFTEVKKKTKELCEITEPKKTADDMYSKVCEKTKEICKSTQKAVSDFKCESKKYLGMEDESEKKTKPRKINSYREQEKDQSIFSRFDSCLSSVTERFSRFTFDLGDDDKSSDYDKPTPRGTPSEVSLTILDNPLSLNTGMFSQIKDRIFSMFYDTEIDQKELKSASSDNDSYMAEAYSKEDTDDDEEENNT